MISVAVIQYLVPLITLLFPLACMKHYNLPQEPIDVVIPCAAKDLVTLDRCIRGVRTYGAQIRRIIVVSAEPYPGTIPDVEWFDEKKYPFSKADVAQEIFQDTALAEEFLNHHDTRIGWIYQQLLKLYAPFIIPNISSNVLILDADTIFLQPINFLNEQGEGLYNPGREYHQPYFHHMARLLPGLRRVFPAHSGIANHMLFQRSILEDLFTQLTIYHGGIEPWKALCRCIDPQDAWGSGMSEYEIYFNFVFAHTLQVHLRKVHWNHQASLPHLKQYEKEKYVYVSCHSYLQ